MSGQRQCNSHPVRLAALGMFHEANTFARHQVDTATFETTDILRGNEITAKHAGGETTMAGFLAVGEDPVVEVVPLVMTSLWPAEIITAEALQARSDELVTAFSGPPQNYTRVIYALA